MRTRLSEGAMSHSCINTARAESHEGRRNCCQLLGISLLYSTSRNRQPAPLEYISITTPGGLIVDPGGLRRLICLCPPSN
jgi:hypothetical protein